MSKKVTRKLAVKDKDIKTQKAKSVKGGNTLKKFSDIASPIIANVK